VIKTSYLRLEINGNLWQLPYPNTPQGIALAREWLFRMLTDYMELPVSPAARIQIMGQ
jgi:hypothetical protein